MPNTPWPNEFPAAITVCDADGIVLEMNDDAAKLFAKDGGRALIGTNLLDCHPEPSRTQLQEMLATQRVNTYTIETGGVRKLIYQAPWYEDGVYGGFVEFSFVLPDPLPHLERGEA